MAQVELGPAQADLVIGQNAGLAAGTALGSAPGTVGATVSVKAVGRLYVDVAPVAMPSDMVYVKRHSETMPSPTLDSKGRPVQPWIPASHVTENWGRLQIVFNGVDVTFFRGVATEVSNWGSTEPFDDSAAVLSFPQITPLEPLPYWLTDWAEVEIKLVRPDGTRKILWEGLFASEGDSANQQGSGLTLECIGVLFQLDLYLTPPPLAILEKPEDVGRMIAREFNPLSHFRQALKFLPMAAVTTGITTIEPGSWNSALTSYVQGLLAKTTIADGSNQWTVLKDPGRVPVMKLKDRTTVHWTVHVAQRGVSETLDRDLTQSPNAYYGEGINDDIACRWRNAKYPNIRTDDAPVFDGNIISPGESTGSMRTFSQELADRGWGFTVDNLYHAGHEQTLVRRFQDWAGIQVDGEIGPQTWAAAFEVGSNGGDLSGAFFMPIAEDRIIDPWNYAPNGAIIGPNLGFDRSVVRIERYENFGNRVSKEEGIASAEASRLRDSPPVYSGTLTLQIDPQEGSRYEMKAGQNILLRGHRGVDRLFHIAEVSVNFSSGTVALTVDERARDLLTLSAIQARERDNTDPARRRQRTYRNSRAIEDRAAVWDCESGSGVIPRHATYNKLWNVLRIPAGEAGSVVRAEFTCDTAARMSVAIFDRPTSHQLLRRAGDNPLVENYWDQFAEETGLIIAWGGDGQAGGFYPGSESEGNPLTGKLVDNALWHYESTSPPWLWVAIWVESPTINYISGRLYPSSSI